MAGEDELPPCAANYSPLSPISFLQRSAQVYPDRLSLVYGTHLRHTWSQTYNRCKRLASALRLHFSLSPGDTVSVVAPNIPAIYEAHFGIPMAGAIINAINIRLDARTISYLLHHSRAKAILVDQEFFDLVSNALSLISSNEEWKNEGFALPSIVVIEDPLCDRASLEAALHAGAMTYEELLLIGDETFQWTPPKDEWDSIALNYTSGTTSNPKGVLLSHRGAYLSSISACMDWGLGEGCVYLWTLPLFHCNGWCYSWGMATIAGTNICLRQVIAKGISKAIVDHGVTHFCAAPTVLNLMVNALDDEKRAVPPGIQVMTAGAAPPPSVLSRMEAEGFRVTHTYGLTETYGPCTICVWKEEWDKLPLGERALLKSRQGVRYTAQEGLDVITMNTLEPVPADGVTIGEVVMRGNMTMKGYLRSPEANTECFKGGWFHSGDLGVKHPDGYIEIKDRAKDIIISGGENISTLEVESIIYRHPKVLEASVVARPDEEWGESPCAFITLKPEVGGVGGASAKEIIDFCRSNLPRFMVPKSVIFGSLPKTATGKIQKHKLRAQAKALGTIPMEQRSRL